MFGLLFIHLVNFAKYPEISIILIQSNRIRCVNIDWKTGNIFHRIEIFFSRTLFDALSFHSCGCNKKKITDENSLTQHLSVQMKTNMTGMDANANKYRFVAWYPLHYKNAKTKCLLTEGTFGLWSIFELFEFCVKVFAERRASTCFNDSDCRWSWFLKDFKSLYRFVVRNLKGKLHQSNGCVENWKSFCGSMWKMIPIIEHKTIQSNRKSDQITETFQTFDCILVTVIDRNQNA